MNRFRNILYVAQDPEGGDPALSRATALAESNGAQLTLMAVAGAMTGPGREAAAGRPDVGALVAEALADGLAGLSRRLAGDGHRVATRAILGTTFIEVIRTVLQNGHDLVVKGAQPAAGPLGRALGSTDLHLLRKCPCPVWIDRPGSRNPYARIIAAVDPVDDPHGLTRLVMDLATSLAEREAAALHLVHAWRLYGEATLRAGRSAVSPAELEALLAEAREGHGAALAALASDYGLDPGGPGIHLVKGEASEVIATASSELDADLIVMGTLGRTGIPGLFIGNTAEEVLTGTSTSILAVKPPGFVSPVTL